MNTTAKEKLEKIIKSSEFKAYYKARTLVADLAVKIKMTRENLGWSQEELAEKMGITQSSVARMESGTTGISTSTLEKFCNATQTKIDIVSNQSKKQAREKADVYDICKYLITKSEEILKDDYDLSHLKLHKLLFYIQKEYIKKKHFELLNNKFEAWEHGPVYAPIYKYFKNHKNNPISSKDCEGVVKNLSKEQMDIIDYVLEKYVGYSAWELREMTHREGEECFDLFLKVSD